MLNIFGDILIGFFTPLGAYLSIKWNYAQREKSGAEALLKSLLDELRAVLKRYDDTAGKIWKDIGDEPTGIFPYYEISQDYLSIYNNNADKIGLIPDDDLRREIIEGYTLMKGLIDSYKFNNFYNRELEKEYEEKGPINHKDSINLLYLRQYFTVLQKAHKDLLVYIPKLIDSLSNFIDEKYSKHEKRKCKI